MWETVSNERTYRDPVSGGRAGTAVSSKTAGTVQNTYRATAIPPFPTGPAGLEPATPGFGVLTTLLRVVASGSIWSLFLRKTPGPFASDPVWLHLAAGTCAQECAHGPAAPVQPLRICEHPFIIDLAAPSVAHYGPVEVLRLPLGHPPEDETGGAIDPHSPVAFRARASPGRNAGS